MTILIGIRIPHPVVGKTLNGLSFFVFFLHLLSAPIGIILWFIAIENMIAIGLVAYISNAHAFEIEEAFQATPNSGLRICVAYNEVISCNTCLSLAAGSMRNPKTYPPLLSADSTTKTWPNFESRTLSYVRKVG